MACVVSLLFIGCSTSLNDNDDNALLLDFLRFAGEECSTDDEEEDNIH